MSGLIPAVKTALLSKRLMVVRPTGDSELLALIEKMKPVNTGYELIRVGGQGDGGYLIPDDLDGIEYCFSPGVSKISEFENELANFKIRSFMADYAVEKPAITRPEFTFDKKFLGSFNHDQFFTLQSWKDTYLGDYKSDMILQMDIEGAEYEVLLSTPEDLLDQFRVIVIEFHALDLLFDRFAFRMMKPAIERRLQFFNVVHIHPNNNRPVLKRGDIEIPWMLEITFHNRKRARQLTPQRVFPHKLDVDNTPNEHIVLPSCWHA